jgi:hypothetical protein
MLPSWVGSFYISCLSRSYSTVLFFPSLPRCHLLSSCSDYFLSGYWQRAFSSKTDRDLWLGCTGAAVIVFVFLSLVGATGLLAVWGGVIEDLENDASYSFFLLLATMKPWVIGFVLVFTISLSCAAYDTLQTALVATISTYSVLCAT